MKVNTQLKWLGDMGFEAHIDGHKILLDADEKVGGKNMGPRPKKLLLVALGGCTSMDVVSILKKMRVEIANFSVDVESFQTEDEHPFVYEYYKIIFNFEGIDIEKDKDKIIKAVELSNQKYCGVSAMLSKSAPVTYEINVSNQ